MKMNWLQKQMLDIYLDVKRVADKIGVKIFASDGTLLGAARQDGFIPWDDDMDFFMFREDYNLFIEKASELLPNNLFLQTNNSDKNWFFPYAKVRRKDIVAIEKGFANSKIIHGLWIDIFPFDRIISNKFLLFFRDCTLRIINLRFKHFYKNQIGTYQKLLSVVATIIFPSKKMAYKIMNHTLTKYNNNKKANFYRHSWERYPTWTMIFPKCIFNDIILLKFESTNVLAPKKYDEYLTIQYGNWRELPPIEVQNKPRHSIEIVDNMRKKNYEQ